MVVRMVVIVRVMTGNEGERFPGFDVGLERPDIPSLVSFRKDPKQYDGRRILYTTLTTRTYRHPIPRSSIPASHQRALTIFTELINRKCKPPYKPSERSVTSAFGSGESMHMPIAQPIPVPEENDAVLTVLAMA